MVLPMTTAVMNAGWVPIAEAAYLADLSDRQMNRVVDEGILPGSLVRTAQGRAYSRIASAFASFYFNTEDEFTAGLRRRIIVELTQRLEHRSDFAAVASLKVAPRKVDWTVKVPHGTVEVAGFIASVSERCALVEHANRLVSADGEVMGGAPVFAGTRVPVEIVAASKAEGVDDARLKKSYPFLTDELIEAALVYSRIHPRRGRPQRLQDANPTWKLRSRRTIPAPAP
jgi:uncharacterized protein (DUF433 family)